MDRIPLKAVGPMYTGQSNTGRAIPKHVEEPRLAVDNIRVLNK